MEIEFDPEKDKLNLKKHGISLREVERFEWGSAYVFPDEDHYDEIRECAIGYIGIDIHLYYLVFVERFERIRPVSLRRATPREIRRYANS